MPFQRDNFNILYFAFVIIFIVAGLVIMASAINLTVINIRNLDRSGIDAFRRRIIAKKRWQAQLSGDVISGINKQDVVTYMDELPSFGLDDSMSKVCSCEDLKRCFDMTFIKVKNEIQDISRLRKLRSLKSGHKRYFTIRRSPIHSVQHLSTTAIGRDYILQSESEIRIQTEMRRLAIAGDFIHHKKIERRNSFWHLKLSLKLVTLVTWINLWSMRIKRFRIRRVDLKMYIKWKLIPLLCILQSYIINYSNVVDKRNSYKMSVTK